MIQVKLFDGANVERNEWLPRYIDALSSSEVPMRVDLDRSGRPLEGRLDTWTLNPGFHLARHIGTPIRVWRTANEVRMAAPERAAIGLKMGCGGRTVSPAGSRDLKPGDVYLVDQTSTSDLVSPGLGGAFYVVIDVERLGLPVDSVRRAVALLPSSPIYDLFAAHVTHISAIIDDLPEGISQSMLASATLELSRAMITTAAGSTSTSAARDAMHESSRTRVAAYIRQHLNDRDLSAESIARASHMSLRQLYNVWDVDAGSLSEYIISSRLEGARHDLTRDELRRTPISQIASNWGFTNAAHFSRRFRAAYAISPKDWRRSVS